MPTISPVTSRLLSWFDKIEMRKRGRIGDIVKATGYGYSTIAKILGGYSEPTERFISAVCNAYGIDKQWIETGIVRDLTEENEARMEAEAEYMTGPAFDKKEIKFLVYGKDYNVFIEAVNELLSMYEPDRWEAVALLKKLNTKSKTPGFDDDEHDYPPIK